MLVETRSPQRSTTSISVLETFPMMDQSDTFYDAPRRLAAGKDSLAVSSDAASLQKRVMELAKSLVLDRVLARPTDAPMVTDLFPVLVNVAYSEPPELQQSLVEEQGQTQLAAKLHLAFEADPLEDGMFHPAEQIIEKALRSNESQRVLGWLRSLSLDAAHPSFSAEVLRCLGRQTHLGTASWRTELVRDGLAMDNAEIRDAAVRVAEWWGDRDMRTVLKSHSEPETWLQSYIRDVIEDLGE